MIVEFLLFLHFSVVNLIKRLRFCMVQWLQKSLMNCVFKKVLHNLSFEKKPTTWLI
jgi:hypothetical protein